ncbi:MAG TPA: hypothetical protein VFJ96_03970, partial [Gemmatimonadaceae bacterium]|nr:hypothetical protein [Gemmatimonadaceae bacterium]
RETESRAGVTLSATLLFAFAPFVVFMSGSQMNDVPTLAWVMIAIAAMARVMTSDTPRPWAALVSGLGFGIAATIRPVDALAFAAPAGVWYLARALRDRTRWRDAIPAGIGVAIPVLVLLWVNAETTGAPFLFGYELLWGKSHSLGFHKAPWGAPHTPARGLELINLYFLRLQTYLFESPLPSLVPAIGALALARKLDRFDRYLLASSGLLVGFYFSYWFDGFYLGPRFMYLLVPAAALWTARFLPLLKDRFGTGLPYRTGVYGYLTAGVVALFVLIPTRATQYANGLVTMRWDADSAAAAGSIRNAIVLVRESWGAQLVARLWALGVSRSEADLLYGHVDACALDTHIATLEHGSARGEAAFTALRPLLRDSARTVGSPFSPDTTEQYLPGMAYSPRCVARINDDRAGTTLLAPLLLDHGGNNVYARDLHGRDSLLARAFPGRPIYVVRPANADIGTPPQFYRAPTDSLWTAWRSGDSVSVMLAMQMNDQQRATAQRAASDSAGRVLDALLGGKPAPAGGASHPATPSVPHR